MDLGAVDGSRTRDLHLGKVPLYQLSHHRVVRGSERAKYRRVRHARFVTCTKGPGSYWLGIVQSFGTMWIQVCPGASRTASPAALVRVKTSKMSGRDHVT